MKDNCFDNFIISEEWKQLLQTEAEKPYFDELTRFVCSEYQNKQIFPPFNLIFNALNSTSLSNVKVVILGQDPYHDINQANGLCFSVTEGVKFPPSLKNIFKEIEQDLHIPAPVHGDLIRWATQGVLLLNATLTVVAHQPGSHQKRGWERFTDQIISILSAQKENLVFILWGSFAQKKAELINTGKHLILSSAHPSPLSAHRGFFGNRHFSETNEYLISRGIEPINW